MYSRELRIPPDERSQPIAGQTDADTQLLFRCHAQRAINMQFRSLIIALRGSQLCSEQ